MSADDLVGAGISPRERLANIEEMLRNIDSKLDTKADATALIALSLRVGTLEHDLTEAVTLSKERTANSELMRKSVEELKRGHSDLRQRIAYAAGAAAVVVMITEYALVKVFGG